MKRIFSFILAIIMVISLLPMQIFATEVTSESPLPDIDPKAAPAPWDGTVASGFARGEGTAFQPYIIETPQQLAYFAQLVNNGITNFEVHLAADIDLGNVNWTPIGNGTYCFDGIFRGNGYTISGLLINSSSLQYQGLFGKFQGSAYDLTLSGKINTGSLSNSDNRIGLFCGDNNQGTITNVDVSGTVSISSNANRNYIGGFCGTNYALIENCSANVTVNVSASASSSWSYTGGMVGENRADLSSSFSSGSVTLNSSGSGAAGGLCGNLASGINDVTFSDRIYNCYSTANVSASGSNGLDVGGLVGYIGSSVYVENSYSAGSVSVTGSIGNNAGGLIGYVGGGSVNKCFAAAPSVKNTYSEVIKNGAAVAGRLVGNHGSGSVNSCIARSDTAITRTTYFDDGCDTGNTTSTAPSCTAESSTFSYGSDTKSLLGWSSPWVSNGSTPILAHQNDVRCTVRYIKDGDVFCLATQYLPAGTYSNIVSPPVSYYSPSRDIVHEPISADTIIDITYTRRNHSVTITCVDAEGNVLDVYAQTIPEGTSQTLNAKNITGYTPRQTDMTVDMGMEDIHREWIYDVNSHPVTIYYKYLTSGAMAAETFTTTLNYGDHLQVASPAIVGYQVTNTADEVVTIESMGDAPYEKTVYYVEQEQLTYTVVAMLGTTPLSGVTVSFNGEEKVTDSHGQAIFLYDQGTETVTLQLHKDGYSSQAYEQAMDYRLKTTVGIDYFGMKINTADNPNYSVQGISCFGNDISTNSGIINVKYDGLIPIVIKASVPVEDKIQKILLVQEVDALSLDENGEVVDEDADHMVHKILRTVLPGDEALSSDGTCEFTLKGTEFAYKALEKRPIYVYLYTENATEPVIQQLNINTISLSTEIKFEGLFDKAECSLSDTGLPMLDGTKLSFEMDDKYKLEAPFSVEIINNEIYIGYDVTDAFKDEIQNMKDNKLFDKAKDMETRASKFMESMGKAVDNKFADNKWISSDTTTSFKIEAEAAGGMYFTVYEDGKVAAKSYAKVGISMNASWTTDFMVVIIPITVEVKVGLSGEITVTGLGLDFEHQQIIWPTTTVSLAANLRLSAGIGNRYASAGVFGSIKIGTELVLGETTYFDALILNGKGGFYAKLNLGLFKLYGEKSWTFLDKTIRLSPKGRLMSKPVNAQGYLGQFDGLPVYDVSSYSLETVSDDEEALTIPNWSVFSMDSLAEGVLDTAAPQISTVNGKEIMVYFGTAADRDIANAKQLYYQVKNDDGTWTDAAAVADDGTGDTDFDMIIYQDKLYLAYAQSNTVFSSDNYQNTTALLNDMTFAQEITVAVFDPETMTFQTMALLTNDGYYDTLPTFGIVDNRLYLTWNKNTALDDSATFCMNTQNFIWYTSFDGSSWAAPQCALHGCYPVVDLAVTGLLGQPQIALIVDEDASLYTEDDQNLYLTDLNSDLKLINCYGSAISRLQAVTHNGAPLLMWHSDNAVMALADPNGEPFRFSSKDHVIGEDYQYIQTADQQAALLWCVKDIAPEKEDDRQTSRIQIAILNGQGLWGSPMELTTVPYHIMSLDSTLSGGSIHLAAVDTYLSSPEDTGEHTLTTYSKLLYKDYALPRQVRLDSHKTSTIRMQQLEVSITVTNTGATHLDELTFILEDEVKEGDWLGLMYNLGVDSDIPKATKNYTKTYTLGSAQVNLAPGESGTYTFTLPINSKMSMKRTRIIVLFPGSSYVSGGVEDTLGSTIEGVDLGVSGEYIIIDETEFLSIRVDNFGKTTGNGILEVYRQNENGIETLVHSEPITALMSNNIKYYLIKLEKDFFLQTADDFRCVIVSDTDENPENNETTILARKLENQSGTQRDLLVEAPEMTDHKQTLDRYEPTDITLSITMNDDILRYVGCVDMDSKNVDHTLTESEDGRMLNITLNAKALSEYPLGEHEVRFLFLTELGYIDSIFLVNIVDTTPIPLTGQLLVTDGATSVKSAQRGMTLWIDTQMLNTQQIHFRWVLEGSEVGTSRMLVIDESYLGKQLIAEVTGETPYYGTIQSVVIPVEKIQRTLNAPLIANTAGNQVTILQVFHVGNDDLLYGYSTENNPAAVTQWQIDPALTLPGFGTYYLFAKAPGTQVHAPVTSPAAVYDYLCTHAEKSEYHAKEPNCEDPGQYQYFICTLCGQALTPDGTEVTEETQMIPALGHDWTKQVEDNAHLKDLATDCKTCHSYWYGCSRCDAISTTEFFVGSTYGNHHFKNGTCTVCGESDPNAVTLTGKMFTLSFDDEILVNFYFEAKNTGNAQHGMLVFYTHPGTADIAKADEMYDATLNPTNNFYACTTDGIAAKQMGDTRYYAAYAELADGSIVYSPIYDYSPKKYALTRLEKSTDDKMKALCVAMLNYGAAAQRYFNYRTEDLMNASLTAQQQAMVVSYDPGLFSGAIAADPAKIGTFARTNVGFDTRMATVSFDGAFTINYYFTTNAPVDGEVTFYYWNTADYTSAVNLTASNASGEVVMQRNNDGSYFARVTGIAAKQLDDTYYVTAVYSNEDGTYCSGIIAYSLSRYCMNNAKDGNSMQELASSTAVYGYHAKQYFSY